MLGLLMVLIAFCWWEASESFALFKFMAFMAMAPMALTPALILGTAIGWIASRRGSRLQGDIAMAIIVGWAAFLWFRLPPTIAAETPKTHQAIKLDAKLLDACVGQYEFPPNNYMGLTGTKLTIRGRAINSRGQLADKKKSYGAFDLDPESETNFFEPNSPRQFTFIKNGDAVTAVIFHLSQELPDSEGKKLKNN